MTIEQLCTAQQSAPFRPFTIHLPDCRPMHVPHPEFLSIGPTNRIAVVYRGDGSASIIDVAPITGLEMHVPVSDTQRNGS